VKPPIAAKVCAARWRTARVNSSPILPNQSQRSSFAVIGYAGYIESAQQSRTAEQNKIDG